MRRYGALVIFEEMILNGSSLILWFCRAPSSPDVCCFIVSALKHLMKRVLERLMDTVVDDDDDEEEEEDRDHNNLSAAASCASRCVQQNPCVHTCEEQNLLVMMSIVSTLSKADFTSPRVI